jgi:retron-type reverse transcriptase
MKRYGNIWERVCDFENIKEAHRNARKGKTHYGEVKMVDADEEKFLRYIQEVLVNKTYEVSPYTMKIHNDTGKERVLMKLPYFPDRIIQWAVMLQIEHIFMEVFTDFTCASLKNRGIHQASRYLDKFMKDRPGTQYCLKIDVAKFYPSINHEILKGLLRRKFKDNDLLELLDKIIDSMDGGRGVPIGSYLSQYLANFYLAYFDHWLKEDQGVKYVIRYMDDIVILSDSKEWLHNLKRNIDIYLFQNLLLKLKDNWQIFPTDTRGIDFVGYRHFYDFKLLRKSSCKRFKSKMRRIRKKVIKNEPITYHDFCAVNSYLGWLRWCDSFRLIKKYVDPIRAAIENFYETKIKRRKECFA